MVAIATEENKRINLLGVALANEKLLYMNPSNVKVIPEVTHEQKSCVPIVEGIFVFKWRASLYSQRVPKPNPRLQYSNPTDKRLSSDNGISLTCTPLEVQSLADADYNYVATLQPMPKRLPTLPCRCTLTAQPTSPPLCMYH